MRKNTTLLLQVYEVGKLQKPIYQKVAPLFNIKVYKANMQLPLNRLLNNKRFNYSPKKQIFDRILVLSALEQSNARRKAFINSKRNDLIHYFNNRGEKQTIYAVQLSQINHFVPTEHLIQQIQSVLKDRQNNQKITMDKKASQQQDMLVRLQNMLFPFKLKQWQNLVNKNLKNERLQVKNSYAFMQVNNLYMLHFATNREYLYQDMQDFDKFIDKFNFIRYFHQICSNNEFMAQKYCERLIKSIKWRTSQSQQYLLLVLRSNSWERFLLIVEDLCVCYETLYIKKIGKQQKGVASAPK